MTLRTVSLNHSNGLIKEMRTDPIKEGRYLDNKPIGEWIFYNIPSTSYCWEQVILLEKTLTYYEDSIIEWTMGSKIIYNIDTSILHGLVEHSIPTGKIDSLHFTDTIYFRLPNTNPYNIEVERINKDSARLSYNSVSIIDFPNSELKDILRSLRTGFYDRKIKNIAR